jgi:dolichyl-phosphate beta-glucosyltransferase
VVDELRTSHPQIQIIGLPRNRGTGHAVRAGIAAARGAFRLFADADGATPIAELERLEGPLKEGADVVIGSRALPDPSVSVRALTHRVWAGRVFNWLVARVGLQGIADTQCGFKGFRGSIAGDLFPLLRTDGFAFDVELLLLAQRRGYRIVEAAVNWADQRSTHAGAGAPGTGRARPRPAPPVTP